MKVNEQGSALCHPLGALERLILLLRTTGTHGEFLCLNKGIKVTERLEVH